MLPSFFCDLIVVLLVNGEIFCIGCGAFICGCAYVCVIGIGIGLGVGVDELRRVFLFGLMLVYAVDGLIDGVVFELVGLLRLLCVCSCICGVFAGLLFVFDIGDVLFGLRHGGSAVGAKRAPGRSSNPHSVQKIRVPISSSTGRFYCI